MTTLLLAALLLTAAPAGAHDHLEDSTPAADSVVTVPPSDLILRFSAAPRAVEVNAVDAAGTPVALGSSTRDGDTTTVTWPIGTAPGRYVVSWRIISADGHPVGGSYVFTIDPSAPSTPADDAGAGRTTRVVAAVLIVGTIGVAAVIVAARWRGRRRQDESL